MAMTIYIIGKRLLGAAFLIFIEDGKPLIKPLELNMGNIRLGRLMGKLILFV